MKVLADVPECQHRQFNTFRRDINVLDYFGRSCLQIYAQYADKPSLESLKMIMAAGNSLLQSSKGLGSILHFAAGNVFYNTEMFAMLTDLGADWSITDDSGDSVLMRYLRIMCDEP